MTEPTCVPGEPATTAFTARGRCVRATGQRTAPELGSAQRVDSAPHGQRSAARLAQVRHGSAPAKGLQRKRTTLGPEKRRGRAGTRRHTAAALPH
ncbi:hypothetical protein HispidOSU_023008 [Sigmodon hispidus]